MWTCEDNTMRCKSFANNNEKSIHVLRISNISFIAIESVNKETVYDNEDCVVKCVKSIMDDECEEVIKEMVVSGVKKNKGSIDSLDSNCSTNSEMSFNNDSEINEAESVDIFSEKTLTVPKERTMNLLSYDAEDKTLNKVFNTIKYVSYFEHTKKTISNEVMSPLPSPLIVQTAMLDQNSCFIDTPNKVKREILDISERRYTGVLKFYNENKGFGFVGCEQDGSEIFLHGDDLLKANIDIKV